jgi:hypothetical protein
MKAEIVLAYEFVEYIPEEIKERTLYISKQYGTAVHRCCCGCGREVVTPLSPTGWQLTFDGRTVSLYPSIGSWSLPCQSHYFITKNEVVWAPRWSKEQIATGRAQEARTKERYFDQRNAAAKQDEKATAEMRGEGRSKRSLWKKLRKWWGMGS